MNEITIAPQPRSVSAGRLALQPLLPVFLFATVLALTYGYEIFSFNVTIDEDSTATLDSWSRVLGSVGEGRWAMAALSLLLPSSSIPSLSTGLGIVLSGGAWWILARKYLHLPLWPASLAASLAGTIPVLAFIYSFSTVAFAIGIGNVLLVGFVAGMSSTRWLPRVLGVLSAATAIAVYDSFIIAVAALTLALIWIKPAVSTAILTTCGSVAALILSRLIGLAATALFRPVQSPYISSFFDLPGLIDHPRARLSSALSDVWQTITLSPERFGLTSPWLVITIILLLVGAIASVWITPGSRSERALRAMCLAGIVCLPIAAEAVTTVLVLRSMFYLPVILLALFAMSFQSMVAIASKLSPSLRTVSIYAAAALVVLTILGHATISNRLFSTSATTYALDQNLAYEIGKEKEALFGAHEDKVPTVVLGAHSWMQGEFTTIRETFGLSLFSFGEMRTIKFLHTHGVLVDTASPSDSARIQEIAEQLPAYPNPGWVSDHDGVLVINFGIPTTG